MGRVFSTLFNNTLLKLKYFKSFLNFQCHYKSRKLWHQYWGVKQNFFPNLHLLYYSIQYCSTVKESNSAPLLIGRCLTENTKIYLWRKQRLCFSSSSSPRQIVAKECGTICSTDLFFTVKCQQEYKYEHWQILLEINFQQTVLFLNQPIQ